MSRVTRHDHCNNVITRTGAASMHMMTEDCLYLNIYTKNLIKRNSYDYEVGTNQMLKITHAYHAQVQPYAGNRQSSVSLPLRPVILFITGHDFQGQCQCIMI